MTKSLLHTIIAHTLIQLGKNCCIADNPSPRENFISKIKVNW